MINKSYYIYSLLFLIFISYVVLRYIALSNVDVLEDHDGTLYLQTIEIFRTANIKDIINISPDASLMYAFTGALVSIPGWSIEISARLVSFLSAIGLFFIAYVIGNKFQTKNASITGLILLALSPALIGLSVAVLTEPLYVTIVYSGLLIFILYHRDMNIMPSFLMGIIFGLAFLTRFEGILFLGVIPLLQGVYLISNGIFNQYKKKLVIWTTIFLTGFLIVTAIQVSWVSHKMGTFSLSGRQIWTVLIHTPDNKSIDEKLFSLDYSPSQTNLVYLQQNPYTLYGNAEINTKILIAEYGRTLMLNLHDLYNNRLADLVGFVVLIFFALGIMNLYRMGKIFEILFVFIILITGLLAPLLHNVVIRHILVIAPIIFIVAGIGLYNTIDFILNKMNIRKLYSVSIVTVLLAMTFSVWIIPLNSTLKAPAVNRGYDPAEIRHLVVLINQDADNQNDIRIAARNHYLAAYGRFEGWLIPYADYDALVKYFMLNEIDYLFLEYGVLHLYQYPFTDTFVNGYYGNNFDLLYEAVDINNRRIELYKYKSE